MPTSIKSVDDYLASLPKDQRTVISAVRDVILKNLDADFEEGIQYGMIGYYVPHRVYPAGYHCDPRQPLPFAALGAKKNYFSLHLMSLYVGSDGKPGEQTEWFQKAWNDSGKKLDMGKACVRFKSLEDVPLEVVGEVFKRTSAKKWIQTCQEALATSKPRNTVKKTMKKTGKKK